MFSFPRSRSRLRVENSQSRSHPKTGRLRNPAMQTHSTSVVDPFLITKRNLKFVVTINKKPLWPAWSCYEGYCQYSPRGCRGTGTWVWCPSPGSLPNRTIRRLLHILIFKNRSIDRTVTIEILQSGGEERQGNKGEDSQALARNDCQEGLEW